MGPERYDRYDLQHLIDVNNAKNDEASTGIDAEMARRREEKIAKEEAERAKQKEISDRLSALYPESTDIEKLKAARLYRQPSGIPIEDAPWVPYKGVALLKGLVRSINHSGRRLPRDDWRSSGSTIFTPEIPLDKSEQMWSIHLDRIHMWSYMVKHMGPEDPGSMSRRVEVVATDLFQDGTIRDPKVHPKQYDVLRYNVRGYKPSKPKKLNREDYTRISRMIESSRLDRRPIVNWYEGYIEGVVVSYMDKHGIPWVESQR